MAQYSARRTTSPITQQQAQPRMLGSVMGNPISGAGGSVAGKSVSYNATTSDRIFAVSADPSAATVTEKMPTAVTVTNEGDVPVTLMVGYSSYTTDTAVDETDYLHVLLPPGETFSPAVRAVISSAADKTIMFGTTVSNQAPDSNMYTDSAANVDDGSGLDIIGQASETKVFLEPWTSITDHSGNKFFVGDLIRVNDEIMEVTAVSKGDDGTDSDADNLANTYLTVIRGSHGSTAASDHADTAAVRFPFFNAYHDFDKYSVAQTDAQGRFKCLNFFGLGRATSGVQGITPGSLSLKFYNPGYQELGLSGISSSTNSGLTASGEYKLDITVDGGTLFQDLTFTLGSNVNFGGNNGLIAKIQEALDTQFYTAGHLFEKRVSVGIVDGDVRFTSGSHLSTSAILLADTGDSGSLIDAAANGRIPAIGNIDAAVPARLPDNVRYDPVTYTTIPNNVFCYDDGLGHLTGMGCSGSLNYETGALNLIGAPANAEFVISCLHTNAFSGKLTESTFPNSLVDIYANTPQQFAKEAKVSVRAI